MNETNDDSEKQYKKIKKCYDGKYKIKHSIKTDKFENVGGCWGIFINKKTVQ